MSLPLGEDSLKKDSRLGHYVIIEKLAEGGMGTVYKALEPDLERFVAIKILHDDYAADPLHQAQFKEEAKAIAALRHTNIVPLYYVGHEQGLSYFAMAYIEGLTLDDFVEKNGVPLTTEQGIWFMSQAIAALDYAARNNVIHLDIKPSNFLIDKDNIIMLTDFGLARRKKGETQTREAPELMGTPYYASPEHILQQEPDVRTDIYSLGATLFHLLTGKPIFEAESLENICMAQVSEEFPTKRALQLGLPFGWVCLMHRMMEKSPTFRFQSYEELQAALQQVETYRYGKNVICLPSVHRNRALPRYTATPETLFGILPSESNGFEEDLLSPKAPLSGEEVMETFEKRFPVMNLNGFVENIEELCIKAEGELVDLVISMDHSEAFAATVNEVTSFMASYSKISLDDTSSKIELLGLDRAHKLAVTSLMLQKNWHAQRPLDWRGLWQHQICCGLIVEMFYDMLDLKISGLEYAAGLFHDVGKLIYAELFPSIYPSVILYSLTNDLPLHTAEIEKLGIDHAQLAEIWLAEHKLHPALCAAIDFHHHPDEAALLDSRKGLLHSTVGFLKGKDDVDVPLLAHAISSANQLIKQLGLGFSASTWMEQEKWEDHPSTTFLWEARHNDEIEWESFVEFFTWHCHQIPELTLAGYGMPPENLLL